MINKEWKWGQVVTQYWRCWRWSNEMDLFWGSKCIKKWDGKISQEDKGSKQRGRQRGLTWEEADEFGHYDNGLMREDYNEQYFIESDKNYEDMCDKHVKEMKSNTLDNHSQHRHGNREFLSKNEQSRWGDDRDWLQMSQGSRLNSFLVVKTVGLT